MKLLKKEPPDIQQPKKQGGLKELQAKFLTTDSAIFNQI